MKLATYLLCILILFSLVLSAEDSTIVFQETTNQVTPSFSLENDYCDAALPCAERLYCFEQQCTYCQEPFLRVTNYQTCVWYCGAGTTPDTTTRSCVCMDGLSPFEHDVLGRLTCSIPAEEITYTIPLDSNDSVVTPANQTSPTSPQETIEQDPFLTNSTTNSTTNTTIVLLIQENEPSSTTTANATETEGVSYSSPLPNAEVNLQTEIIVQEDVHQLPKKNQEPFQQNTSIILPARNELLEDQLATSQIKKLLYETRIELTNNQPTIALTSQETRMIAQELITKKDNHDEETFAYREQQATKTVHLEKTLRVNEIITLDNETLITTQISIVVIPRQNQTSISIIEVIPKEFAQHVSELAFNKAPVILEEDPVIMWELDDISEPITLTYTVAKNISITGNTIALAPSSRDIRWDLLLPLLFVPLLASLIVFFNHFQQKQE